MITLLGIGLDYMMLEKDPVRGDVCQRQERYAEGLERLFLVIYAPKKRAALRRFLGNGNVTVIPTDSLGKATFFVDALFKAWKVCSENRIDALTAEDPFITGLVGLVLKKRFGLPLNVQIHADIFDNPHWMGQRFMNRILNRLARFIVKRADSIRVGTGYEKQKLASMGVAPEKVRVIPVHADADKFARTGAGADADTIKESLGLLGFKKIVVSAGRLKPQKDFVTLIRAMAFVCKRHPETGLCILGEGPERAALMSEVKRLGLGNNVVMPGAVPHEKVSEYLSACDVFVMSSVFEGTCIALAEACMAGRPVVSTSFAGAYDLVLDGKTGFIAPIGDADAVAEKIIYLIEHPVEAARMGAAAKGHVKTMFSVERTLSGVVRMWEETARGQHPVKGVSF